MDIYRATDETTARPMSCWATEDNHASAYLFNPGYGGSSLLTATINMNDLAILDLRGMRDCDALESLGIDIENSDYSYVYQAWEENQSLISNFDIVIYDDDYPQYCETVLIVSQKACDQISMKCAETWSFEDRERARKSFSSGTIWEILEELDEDDEDDINSEDPNDCPTLRC